MLAPLASQPGRVEEHQVSSGPQFYSTCRILKPNRTSEII